MNYQPENLPKHIKFYLLNDIKFEFKTYIKESKRILNHLIVLDCHILIENDIEFKGIRVVFVAEQHEAHLRIFEIIVIKADSYSAITTVLLAILGAKGKCTDRVEQAFRIEIISFKSNVKEEGIKKKIS